MISSSVSVTVSRHASDGTPGEDIKLENVLGAADSRTVFQLDSRLRPGYCHQLQPGYFELTRDSTKAPQRDVNVGDQVFLADQDVNIGIESSLFRMSYLYSLIRDGQKELGVTAGLSFFSVDTELRAVGTGQNDPETRSRRNSSGRYRR